MIILKRKDSSRLKKSVKNSSQKSIKLDVYSVFLANPMQLLYKNIPIPIAELVPIIVPKKRGRPVIVKTNQSYSVSVIKALLKDIPGLVSMNENFPGITKEECDAISGLKVSYTQYIKARNTLLTYSKNIGQIKKRDAGKLCRMDVNKSGKLYDYFYDNKWLS